MTNLDDLLKKYDINKNEINISGHIEYLKSEVKKYQYCIKQIKRYLDNINSELQNLNEIKDNSELNINYLKKIIEIYFEESKDECLTLLSRFKNNDFEAFEKLKTIINSTLNVEFIQQRLNECYIKKDNLLKIIKALKNIDSINKDNIDELLDKIINCYNNSNGVLLAEYLVKKVTSDFLLEQLDEKDEENIEIIESQAEEVKEIIQSKSNEEEVKDDFLISKVEEWKRVRYTPNFNKLFKEISSIPKNVKYYLASGELESLHLFLKDQKKFDYYMMFKDLISPVKNFLNFKECLNGEFDNDFIEKYYSSCFEELQVAYEKYRERIDEYNKSIQEQNKQKKKINSDKKNYVIFLKDNDGIFSIKKIIENASKDKSKKFKSGVLEAHKLFDTLSHNLLINWGNKSGINISVLYKNLDSNVEFNRDYDGFIPFRMRKSNSVRISFMFLPICLENAQKLSDYFGDDSVLNPDFRIVLTCHTAYVNGAKHDQYSELTDPLAKDDFVRNQIWQLQKLFLDPNAKVEDLASLIDESNNFFENEIKNVQSEEEVSYARKIID